MSTTHFSCSTCRRLFAWRDANANGTGSFCSVDCITLFRQCFDGDEGPQLQMFPEQWIDQSAWRHQQGEQDVPEQLQVGQNDFGPPGGQIDDLKTWPLFG